MAESASEKLLLVIDPLMSPGAFIDLRTLYFESLRIS